MAMDSIEAPGNEHAVQHKQKTAAHGHELDRSQTTSMPSNTNKRVDMAMERDTAHETANATQGAVLLLVEIREGSKFQRLAQAVNPSKTAAQQGVIVL